MASPIRPRPFGRAAAEPHLTAVFHGLPVGWICISSQTADGRWEDGYARIYRAAL